MESRNKQFVWCGDGFDTKAETEAAIAASLVENLNNTNDGMVEHGDEKYFILVSVTLVE